ncbi:MAG: tyrosine-type recombinase/integrase [Bradyrhizobium sp.]|uniref:site-specific integrase n=1 Tax=Bradyrhizobium sp. TaxID=376 RepID=UPI0029AD8D0D|nr:tyrosine-type recombinase/integrase [Bradyrhizobium sp.]MDX3968131.1 tyrosine-type recombinase/integrase [Bradyrhizobium sp.]
MKGHIRERSPGRWAIVLDVRDPQSAKRKRRWHSFQGTKRQAQTECARLIADLQRGTYLEPNKILVSQYLDHWLEHIHSQVSPRTYERYAEIARKNVAPLLGAIRLTQLKPAQISCAYSTALKTGRSDGKGLSPRTVHHCHRILKQSLKQAVRWQILANNPADAVAPPKVERKAMQTYDVAQTAKLIDTMRGTPLFVPTILAALCGLRRGEIAALRWGCVHLDAGQMAIVQSAEQMNNAVRLKEPKTGRARTVALPSLVVEELTTHRVERAETLLRLGIRLSEEHFVCCHDDASMMQPTYLTHQWLKAIRRSGLPIRRLHDLRHTHATQLLASGVHPKIASERLGHSKVGITLDLYSHVLPGMQEDAAAKIDDALRRAMSTLPQDR